MDAKKLQFIIELIKMGDGAKLAVTELEKLADSSKKSERATNDIGMAVEKLLLRYVSLAAALSAGQRILGQSTQAYQDQERAVQRLENSLRGAERFSVAYSRTLQNQANQLQFLTNVSDETINGVQATLVEFRATQSELEVLTPLVLDFGKGIGSIEQAARAVGAALQGEYTPAARALKVDLNENLTRSEKLAVILDTIRSRYGGLAQATRDQAGAFASLKTELNEVAESLGKFVLEGVEPVTKSITESIKFMTWWMALMSEARSKGLFDVEHGIGALLMGKGLESVFSKTAADIAKDAAGPEKVEPSRKLDPDRVRRELEALEAQLTLKRAREMVHSLDGNIDSPDRLHSDFAARATRSFDLTKAGIMAPRDGAKHQAEAEQTYHLAVAEAARRGYAAVHQVHLESMSLKNRERHEIEDHYDALKREVETYYAYELEQAQFTANGVTDIELEKEVRLEQLRKQRQRALSEDYQMMLQVGRSTAQLFSSGLANAIVSAASSTKSAGEIFRQFFAELMQQVSALILQILILRAISSIFGSMGGGGTPGIESSGSATFGNAMPAGLSSGMLRRDGGIDFAASGALAGVNELNQATFFPRFNVVAGEAGREMMAVFAKPSYMSLGGLSTIVGNVKGNRLAMVDYSALQSALTINRPRYLAEGGMVGAPAMSGSAGAPGGAVHIRVSMQPGLKAEIVNESVVAAKVEIQNDLHQDTPISSQIKNLTR